MSQSQEVGVFSEFIYHHQDWVHTSYEIHVDVRPNLNWAVVGAALWGFRLHICSVDTPHNFGRNLG